MTNNIIHAIILHARWGGFIRERGLAVMSVFGNIVVSLSWFGVNMLASVCTPMVS
jgi:hypothetical protein